MHKGHAMQLARCSQVNELRELGERIGQSATQVCPAEVPATDAVRHSSQEEASRRPCSAPQLECCCESDTENRKQNAKSREQEDMTREGNCFSGGRGAKRDRDSSTETATLISSAAYSQVGSVIHFVQGRDCSTEPCCKESTSTSIISQCNIG